MPKKIWSEWATRTEQAVSVEDLVSQSRELGARAFHKGIIAAPAQDPEFMFLIANAPQDWGDEAHRIRVAMMNAWADAWHDENLKEGSKWGESRQKHEDFEGTDFSAIERAALQRIKGTYGLSDMDMTLVVDLIHEFYAGGMGLDDFSDRLFEYIGGGAKASDITRELRDAGIL